MSGGLKKKKLLTSKKRISILFFAAISRIREIRSFVYRNL
jgi:predicted RNase H-like nuclease